MKKTKLLSLALATLMLGACSSEDVVVVNEGSVPPGGNGYLSFAFNLPTTPSSRANDNFDDGETYEYNVKDATLLLFAGNNEAGSKFQGAYNLALPDADQPGYNVTTRYSIVQQVTKPVSGNVYAMVILNGKASGVVTESAGTWTLNETTLTNATTFESLYTTAKEMNLANIANTTDGCFLMTNAPMFTAPGGTSDPSAGEVQTLSVIDKDRIYATSDEAKANPAADIYCERAVAKVTVKANEGIGTGPVDDTQIASYTFKGWTLDITSRESFLVRNVANAPWWSYESTTNGVTDYRFVGSVGLTNTATQTLYRTYWGIDPTYDGDDYNTGLQPGQVDENHFKTTIGKVPTLTDMDKDAYCLENTFDVDNQNQNQTTRVIVAAQLTVKGANGDKSFFILNDNKDVIYDTEDKIKEIVSTAYMNVPEIRQVLETNLKAGKKLDNSDLTVTFTKPADNAGYWTVASITVNPASASNFNTGTIPAELTESNPTYTAAIASVNKDYNIAYYAGGVSYYGVRIRHFDENQTPWAPNGDDDSYEVASGKDKDNEYLGRYGVLRNNWYEVNVTGIRNIGSPVPDEVYGQDDPQEQWISVRINVLAWAKRSQNVDL